MNEPYLSPIFSPPPTIRWVTGTTAETGPMTPNTAPDDSTCPLCGQQADMELRWTVKTGKKVEVSVRQGHCVGWALRRTEQEARDAAMQRMRAMRTAPDLMGAKCREWGIGG